MDIYRFIDSKDIRKYLQTIGYNFSTTEAAFLVWQSTKTTLDEKFTAWREIIDTMPDCSIDARRNSDYIESFHTALQNCMKLPSITPYLFEDMWFAFPTPFRRGDILISVSAPKQGPLSRQPFVLERICTWDTSEMIRNGFSPNSKRTIDADRIVSNLAKYGDVTDMSASGYFKSDEILKTKLKLYTDNVPWYLGFEYFYDDLGQYTEIIHKVSEKLKAGWKM